MFILDILDIRYYILDIYIMIDVYMRFIWDIIYVFHVVVWTLDKAWDTVRSQQARAGRCEAPRSVSSPSGLSLVSPGRARRVPHPWLV